jgi:hypothetical protein
VVLAVSVLIALGASIVGAKPRETSNARAVSGTAYLADTPKPGHYAYVTGYFHDTTLGDGVLLFVIRARAAKPGPMTISAKSVTLYTASGSLSGGASTSVTITNFGPVGVSLGRLDLTQGAGSLKGHSLKASFCGLGNWKTRTGTLMYSGTLR